jgi:hypothetical protein
MARRVNKKVIRASFIDREMAQGSKLTLRALYRYNKGRNKIYVYQKNGYSPEFIINNTGHINYDWGRGNLLEYGSRTIEQFYIKNDEFFVKI